MEMETPRMLQTSTIPSSVVSNRVTTTELSNLKPFSQVIIPVVQLISMVRINGYKDANYTNFITVLSHTVNETERLSNDTISGLYTAQASHVGQIFFDQSLISEVENQSPYNENTQTLTENADDSILLQEADDIDPFVQYVYVNGADVTDGIFAWISLAIDSSEDSSVTPAGYLTSSGGVANPNSGAGGPGGPQ